MNWYVSVFTAAGDRLIWASGPVDTLTETMRLAQEAARAGHQVFIRSPTGEVHQFAEYKP